MSNSFLNIPNFYASGIPERSSIPLSSSLRLQADPVSSLTRTINPPPGFSISDRSLDETERNSLPDNYSQTIDNSLNKILKSLPAQNQVIPINFYKQFSRGFYPKPYRYMKYHHFNDRRKRGIQKSAYIVASIKADDFKQLGAIEYIKGVCIILKQYEPVNTCSETCAIIGLSKQWIHQLAYRFSHLYHILRSLSVLHSVPGIKDLSPYKLNILRNLTKYINELDDNELVLFNIEPKGQTHRSQHHYPNANICLPGGGMEPKDECDWKKTAFREFEEETGVNLTNADIRIIDQQKCNNPDREIMYIILKINNLR